MLGRGRDRWSGPRAAPGALWLGLVMVVSACAPLETASPNTSSPRAPSQATIDSGRASVADADDGLIIEVVRVIDGDSLEVSADGEVIEVRLLGINAPERSTLADRETCAGRHAGATLESLLENGGQLRLYGDEMDRFGRLLADIAIDAESNRDAGRESVADAMVRSGWALALWSGDDPFLVEEMRKVAARVGWWGTVCGTVDVVLEISGEQVNAPGDDRENLTEEWVEVTNAGPEPVDLDGWTIRDETTSNRFLINDLVLQPGAVVRFRTGVGSSSSTEVFLNESFPVWSNRGETVLLVDSDGVIAAYAFIEG